MSTTTGLTAWQIKLLLDLIEVNGGIESFKNSKSYRFAKLCNNNTNNFGEPKSKTRRQFENKIARLKKKTPLQYLKILNRYKVIAFQEREAPDENSDQSDTENNSDNYQESPSALTKMSEVIHYDDTNPTNCDRIAGIFPTTNIVGKDKSSFYEGFDIWMEIDHRSNTNLDPYKAYINDDKQVRISVPAWNYAFQQRDNLKASVEHAQLIDADQKQRIIASLDNALHVNQDREGSMEEKFYKDIYIEFPCEVSIEPLSKVRDNRIPSQIFIERCPFGNRHWIIWTVANMDKGCVKIGKVQEDSVHMLSTEFAQLMGNGLQFGSQFGTGGMQTPFGTGGSQAPFGTGGSQAPFGTGGSQFGSQFGTGGMQTPFGTGGSQAPFGTGGSQAPFGTGGSQAPTGGSQAPFGTGGSQGRKRVKFAGRQSPYTPFPTPTPHGSTQPGSGATVYSRGSTQASGIAFPPAANFQSPAANNIQFGFAAPAAAPAPAPPPAPAPAPPPAPAQAPAQAPAPAPPPAPPAATSFQQSGNGSFHSGIPPAAAPSPATSFQQSGNGSFESGIPPAAAPSPATSFQQSGNGATNGSFQTGIAALQQGAANGFSQAANLQSGTATPARSPQTPKPPSWSTPFTADDLAAVFGADPKTFERNRTEESKVFEHQRQQHQDTAESKIAELQEQLRLKDQQMQQQLEEHRLKMQQQREKQKQQEMAELKEKVNRIEEKDDMAQQQMRQWAIQQDMKTNFLHSQTQNLSHSQAALSNGHAKLSQEVARLTSDQEKHFQDLMAKGENRSEVENQCFTLLTEARHSGWGGKAQGMYYQLTVSRKRDRSISPLKQVTKWTRKNIENLFSARQQMKLPESQQQMELPELSQHSNGSQQSNLQQSIPAQLPQLPQQSIPAQLPQLPQQLIPAQLPQLPQQSIPAQLPQSIPPQLVPQQSFEEMTD